MGYAFPDVEAGVAEVLDDLGLVTTWLDYGFEAQVTAETCVIHVEAGQGNELGPFRTEPVTVACYGDGRDAAIAAAEAVRARLVPGPHGTTVGLLDKVDVSATPGLVPYPHDRVTKAVAAYAVDMRPT